MPHVPMSAASMISDEVNELIRAQDDALLANQMLFVSLIKSARSARLPFKDEQRMFASLHTSASKMMETRWAIGENLKLIRGLATVCGAEAVMEGCSAACPVSTITSSPEAVSPAIPATAVAQAPALA